jgi:hypothetical protein
MAVDHQSAADEIDNFDLLSTEQRAKARRTVAAYSDNADDADLLFRMLGIHPSQEREICEEVNRPKLPRATPSRRNGRLKTR